jgi:hypothetical protein
VVGLRCVWLVDRGCIVYPGGADAYFIKKICLERLHEQKKKSEMFGCLYAKSERL